MPKSQVEKLIPQKENVKKKNYDINVKKLMVGDLVYVKDFSSKKWVKGKIDKILGKDIYMVLNFNNKLWKRHADHITLFKMKDNFSSYSKVKARDNLGGQIVKSVTLTDVLKEKIKVPLANFDHTSTQVENELNDGETNSENSMEFEDAIEIADLAVPVETSNEIVIQEPGIQTEGIRRSKRVIKSRDILDL